MDLRKWAQVVVALAVVILMIAGKHTPEQDL